MATTVDDLIAKIHAQRERWVDLGDGKRVRVRRPAEAEFASFRAGIGVEQIARCCVGWEGFTEADLIGASVGSSSAAPFSAELWREVLMDRVEWAGAVADAVVDAIKQHLESREAALKNSLPS